MIAHAARRARTHSGRDRHAGTRTLRALGMASPRSDRTARTTGTGLAAHPPDRKFVSGGRRCESTRSRPPRRRSRARTGTPRSRERLVGAQSNASPGTVSRSGVPLDLDAPHSWLASRILRPPWVATPTTRATRRRRRAAPADRKPCCARCRPTRHRHDVRRGGRRPACRRNFGEVRKSSLVALHRGCAARGSGISIR